MIKIYEQYIEDLDGKPTGVKMVEKLMMLGTITTPEEYFGLLNIKVGHFTPVSKRDLIKMIDNKKNKLTLINGGKNNLPTGIKI